MKEYEPNTNRMSYSIKDIILTFIGGISIGFSLGYISGDFVRKSLQKTPSTSPEIQQIEEKSEIHQQPFTQSELPDKLNEDIRLK